MSITIKVSGGEFVEQRDSRTGKVTKFSAIRAEVEKLAKSKRAHEFQYLIRTAEEFITHGGINFGRTGAELLKDLRYANNAH